MTNWLLRTFTFARFTLAEYTRSGRILVELAVLAAAVWLLLWPRGSEGIDPNQFFSLGSFVILALAAYTTFMCMRMGRRPEAYVLLARPLGRTGYLAGLYLGAMILTGVLYLTLAVTVVGLNWAKQQPPTISLAIWLSGTIPLLLDTAIVASLVTLISPLVLSTSWRLLVVAVLAVSLSVDLDVVRALGAPSILDPIQAAAGLAALPLAGGLQLAIERNYDLSSVGLLAGQLGLTTALLGVALLVFRHRELILTS